jgi:hypothetical protein
MKSLHCRLMVATSLVIAVSAIAILPLSAQSTCSAPLPSPPHQGGGRSASTIFGVQAVISYGNPVFACRQNWDSYTNEWIMIVGPGNSMPNHPEWIQVGWERSHVYETVHFWYQYIGPGLNYCTQTPPIVCIPRSQHIDPAQHPVSSARTFTIEAIGEPDGATNWLLWADNLILGSISASELGWTGSSQYGSDVQWSGEVSYFESEMGGPASNPVSIVYPMWYVGEGWDYIYDPYTFSSWHPKYGGDAIQNVDGTWRFRNWTWSNFLFLPLILKDH